MSKHSRVRNQCSVSINIFIILIISFVKFSLVQTHRSELISKLVKDIIENERVPSILYEKTCWFKNEEVNFAKSLRIPVQIVNSITPINLKLDENTNKQWIFVDMKCDQGFQILSTVHEKYLAHPYRWIIVDATNESIQSLNSLPGSNVICVNQEADSRKYVLKQGLVHFVAHEDGNCNAQAEHFQ